MHIYCDINTNAIFLEIQNFTFFLLFQNAILTDEIIDKIIDIIP